MHALAKGITLIELLCILSCSLIVLGIGAPALDQFIERAHNKNIILKWQQLLQFSREQAINYKKPVTLCPLNAALRCHMAWNDNITLFLDTNNNRQLDSNERILFTQEGNTHSRALLSHNNSAISFNADGFSAFATGSLGYCFKKKQTIAAVFIIARTGRIRRGTDSNQDGIPETASGANVPCPV